LGIIIYFLKSVWNTTTVGISFYILSFLQLFIMYGRSGASNGISPRSKILSLGVSAPETVPLRFRPLPKAADFPFESPNKYNEHNQYQNQDAYGGGGGGGGGDYGSSSNADDYYQPQEPPAGHDFEDKEHYSDFQKRMIDQHAAAIYAEAERAKSSRVQNLTLGLQSTANNEVSPRIVDREEFRTKYAEYQKKLVADEAQPVEQTRAKFVRKPSEECGPGLVIGRQSDPATDFRQKREAQAAYKEKLLSDMQSRPIAGERKQVQRRAVSPEPKQMSFMDQQMVNRGSGFLGTGTGGAGASGSPKKDLAQFILEHNRDDVMARLNEAETPERQRNRKEGAHSRIEEVSKFEEAPYRFIGGSEASEKSKKKAMQEKYLSQLLADNGPLPSVDFNQNSTNRYDEYVNKSGWTGLHIGGHSRDEAHKGDMLLEKQYKQAAYKRLLDQQRVQAEDLLRTDRQKYGKY
jgi:hypothetical protein